MNFSLMKATLPDFLETYLLLLLAPSSLSPSAPPSLPFSLISSLTAWRARYFAERLLFEPDKICR
jgi:hypothetical protein